MQLVELPTDNESNDNIVASWAPKETLDTGRPSTYGYRITALTNDARLTPGARSVNTFRSVPRALGAADPTPAGATRFLIDFSGGDLGYYLSDPTMVEIVASTSAGRVTRTFLRPTRICEASAPASMSRSIPARAATSGYSCAPGSGP